MAEFLDLAASVSDDDIDEDEFADPRDEDEVADDSDEDEVVDVSEGSGLDELPYYYNDPLADPFAGQYRAEVEDTLQTAEDWETYRREHGSDDEDAGDNWLEEKDGGSIQEAVRTVHSGAIWDGINSEVRRPLPKSNSNNNAKVEKEQGEYEVAWMMLFRKYPTLFGQGPWSNANWWYQKQWLSYTNVFHHGPFANGEIGAVMQIDSTLIGPHMKLYYYMSQLKNKAVLPTSVYYMQRYSAGVGTHNEQYRCQVTCEAVHRADVDAKVLELVQAAGNVIEVERGYLDARLQMEAEDNANGTKRLRPAVQKSTNKKKVEKVKVGRYNTGGLHSGFIRIQITLHETVLIIYSLDANVRNEILNVFEFMPNTRIVHVWFTNEQKNNNEFAMDVELHIMHDSNLRDDPIPRRTKWPLTELVTNLSALVRSAGFVFHQESPDSGVTPEKALAINLQETTKEITTLLYSAHSGGMIMLFPGARPNAPGGSTYDTVKFLSKLSNMAGPSMLQGAMGLVVYRDSIDVSRDIERDNPNVFVITELELRAFTKNALVHIPTVLEIQQQRLLLPLEEITGALLNIDDKKHRLEKVATWGQAGIVNIPNANGPFTWYARSGQQL